MARTTFSGPVASTNGFIGAFTGGTTNLALTGTLSVGTTSTLTGAVSAPAGVTGNLTGTVTGNVVATAGYIQLRTATSVQIAAIGNAINTTGKAAGTIVFDTTLNTIKIATGALAASTWVNADGTTAITPA